MSRLRLTFLLTVIMTVIIFVVVRGRDKASILPLVVALVVLMAFFQMTILLWGGVSQKALNAARQHYRRGDFQKAAQLLEEALTESPAPPVEMLALLGNTYRQLGNLSQSETRLREAVAVNPNDKLALYGLGRTLMARGHYAEAAKYMETALENGGQKVIRADLALALYYGEAEKKQVVQTAHQAARLLNLEPYRALMVNYLLYNLEEETLAKRVIQNTADGLAYWQAQARQYAETDYGRRVASDVITIKALLNGEQLDA